MKSAFKSFAEAFDGGCCALAGGSRAPEDRRPNTKPDEADLAMMDEVREKTWRLLIEELANLNRGRSNTQFRDAGGQSPALRTDDQPHSL